MLWRITQGLLFHFRVITGRLLARASHNPGDFAANWIRDNCRPSCEGGCWEEAVEGASCWEAKEHRWGHFLHFCSYSWNDCVITPHHITYSDKKATAKLHGSSATGCPELPTWWDTAGNSPSLATVYHWLCLTQGLPLLEGSLKEDLEINVSIGRSLEIPTGVCHIPDVKCILLGFLKCSNMNILYLNN